MTGEGDACDSCAIEAGPGPPTRASACVTEAVRPDDYSNCKPAMPVWVSWVSGASSLSSPPAGEAPYAMRRNGHGLLCDQQAAGGLWAWGATR